VQLPIFNEKVVSERLIDHVVTLSYPKDLIDIQVLDDSTDETVALVAAKVHEYHSLGFDISHLRRESRAGFKAGALREGLSSAKGQFIAIFDADFMPPSDFLLATIPYFDNPTVAMVQTRWGHVNRESSLLTRVQSLLLDVHFKIEQIGRAEQGCFLNFNGTAGVWRASAIHDSGNWRDTTLTEDLDLSYRAQLRGWRFVYLENVRSPALLPEDIGSFRSQQFRWIKGIAQNAVYFIPRILRAKLTLRTKLHACIYLLETNLYAASIVLIVLTLPLALFEQSGMINTWAVLTPFFCLNAIIAPAVYFVAYGERRKGLFGLISYTGLWLGLSIMTTGLALHNTIAIASGYFGSRGEFVRTPKGYPPFMKDYDPRSLYYINGVDRITVAEIALWCYLLISLVWAAYHNALHLFTMPAAAFLGLTYLLVSVAFMVLKRPSVGNS
jgi:cellulose synthase/poly-beta-1,6-N-acetylglucosamine synthase-like glycosyltransferase